MLIGFSSLVSRYGKPTGIIHIGAHWLEERNEYLHHGLDNTIWIEANSELVATVRRTIPLSPNERLFNCMVGDIDNQEREFFITNNGQSSSMLQLGTHKTYYPEICVTQMRLMMTKRVDTLFTEENIDPRGRNFLNLDIQGAELLALRGFGEQLSHISYIYTEVNLEALYSGCCRLGELDRFLNPLGFLRVDTVITNEKWGDAFYIR